MDRLIYVAMTGAKHAMYQQATVSQNLANVSTPGFRADLAAFRAVPVQGGGAATRSFVVEQTTGADFSPGVIQQTGRDLDMAVTGPGWITVQTPNGEAYTRNGSFELDPTGMLRTRNGYPVIGDAGPMIVPPDTRVSVGKDGTVSAISLIRPSESTPIGRIKLVNPDAKLMEKGNDGLFRQRDGQPAQADAAVELVGGALEGSNVNSVAELVNMISFSRQYDMQIKLLATAEQNARTAGQVLTLS